MKSPITGKEMILKKEKQIIKYNNQEFIIMFNFYECVDSCERYEDEEMAQINYNQVINQFLEKNKQS